MNFGIQLQRNSARSFRVGKVPALLGQAGLKEFRRDVHGLVLEGETEFISSHERRLSEASIWRLGLELKLVGLEASYSGLLVRQAGPPSSIRSNPSRQLWQPVLIALALIPIYTVNDSAPREQRTITATASTNAAAYETHPGESYTARREPLSL
nr:hypothetical protein [Tanacetum cinerariifolium]